MKNKNQTKKDNLQSKLTYYKNKIKNLIRSSKKKYFTKYFTQNSNNAKKLWKGINLITSSRSKSHDTINCFELKDKEGTTNTITDSKERQYGGNKHFTHYLKNNNPNTFLTKPTDPTEIESIIKLSDPSKGVGPNSIPPKIINEIAHIISSPIAKICNKSFKTGTFPDKLKL